MNILKNYNCSASIAHGILNLESGAMIDLNLIEESLAGIAARESSPDAACAQKALSSLRGQVEQAPTSSLNLVGVREVYIEAYGVEHYGVGPRYASLQVDQAFLNTLEQMQKLCQDKNLTEVRSWMKPDSWGPSDKADDLGLQSPELVVTAHSFWFTDSIRHSDEEIQTRLQRIQEFTEKVRIQPDNKRLILGDYQEYAEDLEERDDDPLACDEEQFPAANIHATPAA